MHFSVPISFSLFFGIGLGLFIANRKNIIIERRLPSYVIVDQLMNLVVGFLEYFYSPCLSVLSLGYLTVFIVLIRTTYVYEYLSRKRTFLNSFNRLFWTKTYQLKKRNCFIFACIMLIVGDLVIIIYSLMKGIKLNASCDALPWLVMYSFGALLILLEFCYIIAFIYYKMTDNICMRNELVGRSLSSVLIFGVLLLLRIWFTILPTIEATILGFNYVFWELWYPLLYIVYNSKRTRSITMHGSDYDFAKLKQIGIEFYCPEYVDFITYYRLYLIDEDPKLLNDIIIRFILLNSTQQLNLSFDLRQSVLADPKLNIHTVNTEVMAIITQNFLPKYSYD